MTTEQFAGGESSRALEERMLRARLDSIASSLPTTVWLNPVWALFSTIPFTGAFHLLAPVPLPRLALVVALQAINSAIAAILFDRYRADPHKPAFWRACFTAFQFLIGTAWGAMVWLLWVKGDIANHIMVDLTVICILWAYAMSRTMLLRVYFASVLPTVAVASVRFLASQKSYGWGLEYTLLISFMCTGLLAATVKRQIDTLLKTRFANESLAAELRQAHDEALRKRFEAEAANASKTTFLANMSHELRTPLNAIIGFSDMIANQRLGSVGVPRYREYAGDIHTSGAHLLSIINDILDVAKIESGRMEIDPAPVNPTDAVAQAMKVITPRARERNQKVTIDLAPDVPWPLADTRALTQMAINLLSNAVKFTQRSGSIRVLGRRAADGGFELCVEDNGPGIAPELLDRIFTPFNQLDNRYNRTAGGTGLGLSLVRGLAELHGGRAWLESAPGTGVKAFIYLPVTSEAPNNAAGKQVQPAAA
ncbi:MAG TPA: HAMP domain-containing sensor histidine kinase [Rhizomicrobium sp.]